jgi:hypothetical protein
MTDVSGALPIGMALLSDLMFALTFVFVRAGIFSSLGPVRLYAALQLKALWSSHRWPLPRHGSSCWSRTCSSARTKSLRLKLSPEPSPLLRGDSDDDLWAGISFVKGEPLWIL